MESYTVKSRPLLNHICDKIHSNKCFTFVEYCNMFCTSVCCCGTMPVTNKLSIQCRVFIATL